ncbi:uncharacterized protein BT62DRAFT_927369 [Guyanagaster necrorhizus]|uniref:Uncharacterized protein n=1 Tax=Guyanagaster necrorhizus TaxID=856835 RepID=A0A9P8AXI2_9AGAR|nr:uncharacterized protein BT62DRAFT_927369 [Guyanagaster necrorhizus MCA 3950]KAG7451638.1 hypothetical protein BT62DRAFT_927369 [Guyanagaster necrorhizus MCA 3950]
MSNTDELCSISLYRLHYLADNLFSDNAVVWPLGQSHYYVGLVPQLYAFVPAHASWSPALRELFLCKLAQS